MKYEELYALCESLGIEELNSNVNNILGCCPVHGESRPSWGINFTQPPHVWNCFSCHARGGSVVSLVMKVKNLSFEDAKRYISHYGDLDYTEIENISFTKKFNDIVVAESYYRANKKLLQYRDLPVSIVLKAGLRKSINGTLVPFFQDGEFKGVIEHDRKRGVKSKPLYGFQFKNVLYEYPGADRQSPLILVEGFSDCLRVASFGYPNVAALNGTTFTKEQADRAGFLCGTKLLCMLDNDDAGLGAVENIRRRMPNNVLMWVDYEGPDPDCLRDKDKFWQSVQDAKLI